MRINELLEKRSHNNVCEVTNQLLKQLNIRVTTSTVIEQLELHPDFPSLLSISDNLTQWKVDSLALEVEKEKLEELPLPFVAYTKSDGGNFVLVQQTNGPIIYIDKKGRSVKCPKDEFLQDWNGVVLLAEKTLHSGEANYAANRRREFIKSIKIPAVIAGFLAIVLLFLLLQPSSAFIPAVLLVIKLAGGVVAGLLLWFEVDKSNPVLKQICSAGKQTSCSAILDSKQSKLWGILSWSEIGFYYFAGGFLMLITSASPFNAFTILSWLNLIALPYTVFSIYYQWRVARQWCPLCLTVQVLLLTEAAVCFWGYWSHYQNINISKSDAVPILVSFVLPIFFWLTTKQVYIAANDAKKNKKELSKLKYNNEVFQAILSRQKQVKVPAEIPGIVLGNPHANHTITKVCNPYCDPCARAHSQLEELLAHHDVKVRIIFTASNNKKDFRANPVKHLMAIYEKGDRALIKKSLDDWYQATDKDYEVFADKYPLNGELQQQAGKLEAMSAWCKEAEISFTPTIFIDGFQLPKLYKVEDLRHFL